MADKNISTNSIVLSKSNRAANDKQVNKRQEFWNGTLVDDYNYLMSEELICRCKGSLSEPFTSLNDLSVHHVSYNEFEKQFGEISHWCEKIHETITKLSANVLTRYLRQTYYEELYEQGLMRLRMFGQYADKLNERFPDLKSNIDDKMTRINRQWNLLESCFINYLDEDFDQILHDLHNELILFEEWLSKTEEQLWTFETIRSDNISLKDFQFKLHQHTVLQNEIKSRNSRVSAIIEICERLKTDYEEQSQHIPYDLANDLENRWHQTWLDSVEIQCKLDERLKILKTTSPFGLIDELDDRKKDETKREEVEEDSEEEEDIIPFSSSEYEKIPLTPSNSSADSLSTSINNRKRPRSPFIENLNNKFQSNSLYVKRKMATSKHRMSLNQLPLNTPSTLYYSLTNVNDIDDQIITKRQKKTSSRLDVGYESEDENNRLDKNFQSLTHMKKSHSDYFIKQTQHNSMFMSLTHSLPLFEHDHHLPTWWRHSITSAYDTCSNPDIDLSMEETKKQQTKPSLLMYSKKYTKPKRSKPSCQLQPLLSSTLANKHKQSTLNPPSNSYDASAEYTDPEQSENDVDVLSSDFNSTSPVHHYRTAEAQFYNRYTTTTTTTTGYSSDVELETTTAPSETEDQQTKHLGEVAQMKNGTLTSPLSANSDGFDSLNTIMNEKNDSSEPYWDGYQNPLFYRLNSQDMDSVETILKWEDQFLEMDQPNNTSTDDEVYLSETFKQIIRNIGDSSSTSLVTGASCCSGNKQTFDSDSDLDDFNYVLNETERQLNKARQSLEKKKRQQSIIPNDRNLRKYDEVLRTCETNIQCLQQILTNLHRSRNSRLNSAEAIGQLETYLSGWHDMRQQVNDDRLHARQLLYISQEIIKLKVLLDEELSRMDSIYSRQHPWLDENSLIEIMRRVNYELDSEQESRQKLASFRADILLAEDHLNEYHVSHLNGLSSSNIDEHLNSCRLALEQLTHKMDTYQNQLRTLSTVIDRLLPIETQLEQKLTACEYNNNYQAELHNIQRLMGKYEDTMDDVNCSMMPINNLHMKLKNHCEHKFDLYKKTLQEFVKKGVPKHVSFDGSTNLNNNNSSIIYTTIPHHNTYNANENTNKRTYQRTETNTTSNDINQNYVNDAPSKQSSTTSYISDDCKVLYIETVIEVAKPVFYERTDDTVTTMTKTTTTTNGEHHHEVPQVVLSTPKSSAHFYRSTKQVHESSDDDSTKPVNLTLSNHRDTHKIQQVDSGIEYDQQSPPLSTSSSAMFNRKSFNTTNKYRSKQKHQLIPSVTKSSTVVETTLPTCVQQKQLSKAKVLTKDKFELNPLMNSYWNRLKNTWLRSLLLGLFLLFILFWIYFLQLNPCSKSTLIRTVCQNIITYEREGLPTI